MRPRKGAQTEVRTTRAAERALRRVTRAGAERAGAPEQLALRLPACTESAVRHPRRVAAPSPSATPAARVAPSAPAPSTRAAPSRSAPTAKKAAASAGSAAMRSRASAAAEGRMSGATAGPARTVTNSSGKASGRPGAGATAATSAAVRRHFGELREALADGWEIVQPIFARPLWSAPDDSATAFNFVLRGPRGTRLITVPEGRTVARFIREQHLRVDYPR